jgi:hypothetical protein
MARVKNETVTETTDETAAQPAKADAAAPQEPASQGPQGPGRKKVALVLQGAHQISAEVASEEDARPGRTGVRGNKLDDDLQQVFDQHVAISWERDSKWIAIQVPREAEREAVKRLRYAAEKAGLGLALGNVRPDPTNPENVVRIPFQARKRKVYKNSKTAQSAE